MTFSRSLVSEYYSLNGSGCNKDVWIADGSRAVCLVSTLTSAAMLTTEVVCNTFHHKTADRILIIAMPTVPAVFCWLLSRMFGFAAHDMLKNMKRQRPEVGITCAKADMYTGYTVQGYLINHKIHTTLLCADLSRLTTKISILGIVIGATLFLGCKDTATSKSIIAAFVIIPISLVLMIACRFFDCHKSWKEAEKVLEELVPITPVSDSTRLLD